MGGQYNEFRFQGSRQEPTYCAVCYRSFLDSDWFIFRNAQSHQHRDLVHNAGSCASGAMAILCKAWKVLSHARCIGQKCEEHLFCVKGGLSCWGELSHMNNGVDDNGDRKRCINPFHGGRQYLI